MTFILGMLCEDGIAMCTDSLESDGYNKSNVKKLYAFSEAHGCWGVAWACAGDSPVIRRFNDKMQELLAKENSVYDRHRLEELLETLAERMHEDYPNDRLSLVAALWGATQDDKEELRLYSVKETSSCLSVEERFACAGMDTSLGRFLLDSIFADDITVNEGSQFGAFVTSVMREKADGVGGRTQVIFYQVGERKWVEGDKKLIAEVEKRQYLITDVEQAIRRFCWSRTPHKFRPPK
jgi:20S proteasome alpha/beta subunit